MNEKHLVAGGIRKNSFGFTSSRFFKTLGWLGVAACFAGAIRIAFFPVFSQLILGGASFFFVMLGLVLSVLTLGYFLLQSILAFCYRQAPTLSDEELPRCTVIVPAYNEGSYVATTLRSVLSGDYPADKLEVIAINDGSQDDTWDWIRLAAEEANGRIIPINLVKNGGKRHALYRGFQMATGDIVVTIDSDSEILPDALRKIASPFADAKVGAVAGNIRVSNLDGGIIPKMLDVAFAFGFEFMRCAQSVVHSVLCTPGALSAYRLEAILPINEEWVNQTFLGRPSGIGEDRALSSMIIRDGWYVTYQNDAIALTKMPLVYRTLCKMLIRWCRSDVRENFLMLGYSFGRLMRPNFCWLVLVINLVFQSVAILLPLLFLPMLVLGILTQPVVCIGYTLICTTLWSSIPALIYGRRYSWSEAIWSYAFGLYSIPLLSWISVYSFITMKNSKWLTRGLPAGTAPKAEVASDGLMAGRL